MRPIKTASGNRGFGLALAFHLTTLLPSQSRHRTTTRRVEIMAAERVITYEELMQHQEKDNLWLLLHGKGTLYTWGFSLLSHLEIVCMDVHLVLPYKFPLLTLAPAADSNVQFTTWPSSSTRQVKSHHGCSYFPPLRVFILPLSTLVGKK